MKRRSMWVAVLVAGMALAGSAVQANEQAKDPGKHAHRLQKKLKLTDEQHAQVQQIIQDYQAQMQPLKDQMQQLREQKHSKIRAVLTPEQQEKFNRISDKHDKKTRKHQECEHCRLKNKSS